MSTKSYGLSIRIAISSDEPEDIVVSRLLLALEKNTAAFIKGCSENADAPDAKTLLDEAGTAVRIVELDKVTGTVQPVAQFVFHRLSDEPLTH